MIFWVVALFQETPYIVLCCQVLKMEPLIALWKTLLAPSVPDPSPFFAAGPSSVASPGAAETWKNKA